MAPTKADPLHDRMMHAFGAERITRAFAPMSGARLFDALTDDARAELLRGCLADLRSSRRYAAASRAHYRKALAAQRAATDATEVAA